MRENELKKIYRTIDSGTAREKMANLPIFPKIIEFEITNHCNFSCIMCPTGIGTAKRDRGYMTEEVFGRVISELSGHNVALKFVGQGEPLLHPNAIGFIGKAHKNGIITHLTTNGSLLSEEMIRSIVDEQILDSIKFSFQGIDAEGYYMLRQKDGFDELINIIKRFFVIRGDREKPYMTIGTSITNETKELIEAFVKMGRDICDRVEVGMTQLECSELSIVKNDSYREKLIELRKRQMDNKKRYVCCPQVFDVISIRWNGDITACCGDIQGEMTLGNIMSDSIADCWVCKKEQEFRRLLAEGRYEDISACKDCYDVYGWTYGEN